MGTHFSQKPTTCSVSASSSSSSSSNIKIEHVLNPSSSAPTDTFLQSPSAAGAASALHPLLTTPPPLLPLPHPHPHLLPPPPISLLPLTATLHIPEPSLETPIQFPEYRNHKTLSLSPSASSEQSMAAAVVLPQPAHAMQPFTRPIRFVANDGQPHAKRRRISAACKTCRKRKTRCSGEKPVCETCRQNGHSCLGYTDPTPPVLSHNPQQNNHQVSTRPIPTPAIATPTEKPTLKEPLSTATPTRASLQDRRNTQESSSSNLQQCELLNEPLSGSTPSRKGSQEQKSAGYHQSDGSKGNGDMGSRAAGEGGGTPTDKRPSPVLRYQTPLATQRLAHRIPYFRYFGPTAIVPGYKQMVVEVKGRTSRPRYMSHSVSANSSGTSPTSTFAGLGNPSPTIAPGTLGEIPFYDPGDAAPNNPLIAHLIDVFFVHLGCNFPFLRRETFTRDVEEKRVDVILVDAVCAVAARFSNHPLLEAQARGSKAPQMCEFGTAFANRAKSQVVDTFACPNLATVQACILLAYVEFGSNRDSGLWMFLGIAIRMAQDLGLHKFEGMRGDAKGRKGIRLRGQSAGSEDRKCVGGGHGGRMGYEFQERKDEETEMQEQERTDTFWAVFFLDRVISSGTGRPVTIRSEEVGICPPKEGSNLGYPPPFPALVKIVQLYGRVTDLLNSLNDKNSLAPDTFSRLSVMETELTNIYQQLSPDLHFNVPNFRQYSSTNQGSVFLLLHIWFHTLIVLLHRPTLLIAFEGRVQQRFPNSREVSMSSAKTISDILTFAEIIDPGAVTGNPFTSQPIYIAACAFLQESLTHSSSNTASRSSTPPPSEVLQAFNALTSGNMESTSPRNTSRPTTAGLGSPISSSDATIGSDTVSSDPKSKNTEDCSQTQKKHALLTQAAHLNYQKCYKALEGLEVYWEGVRYILTVLDQKAKGIVDPLLYTVEEMESVELHYWPVWDRFYSNIQRDPGDTGPVPVKLEGSSQMGLAPPSSMFGGSYALERVHSPLGSNIHSDSHQAIGLSATGTTDSPNMNLTWFLTGNEHNHIQQNQFVTATPQHGTLPLHDSRGGVQRPMRPPSLHNGYILHGSRTPTASPTSKCSLEGSTPASDAEMLLGLSAAGQKAGFGQQHHGHHGHHGHAVDGVILGGGYNDGDLQASSGFGYNVMLGAENLNANNIEWHMQCLDYITPQYWDGYTPTVEGEGEGEGEGEVE